MRKFPRAIWKVQEWRTSKTNPSYFMKFFLPIFHIFLKYVQQEISLSLSSYPHKSSSFNCQKGNARHERINSRQRRKNEAFHTNRHDFLDSPMTIHVITSRNGGRKRYHLIPPAEIKSWHQPIDFSECIPITMVALTINLRKMIHIHAQTRQIAIGDFFVYRWRVRSVENRLRSSRF